MKGIKVSRIILPVLLVGALLTMAWGALAAIPSQSDAIPNSVTAAPFLHDFEDGMPAGLIGFADSWDDSGSTTTLGYSIIAQTNPQVPVTVDNDVLNVTYDVAATIPNWGDAPGYAGITYDASTIMDWSAYSAFSFWWYGGDTGAEHRIELKSTGASASGSNRFAYSFMDDFSGWKYFALPFADFVVRTDYNPGGGDSMVLTEMWGYSVLLSAGTAGTFDIDNISVTGYNLQVDFESGIPAGFVGFADSWDDSGSTTTLAYELIDTPLPFIPEIIDNTVLSVTYDVAATIPNWDDAPGYAGVTHNFSETQDWTSFEGLSLWWYGGNTGAEHRIELKTGGVSVALSNHFAYAFLDDFSGWKYFTLPFADFVVRTDYNPGGGDTLEIDQVWGYSVLLSAGTQGTFYLDQIAAYGGVESLSVAFADDLYSVTEGGTATITVILNMASAETVTVSYATSDGTADSSDYTSTSGELVFDPGVTEQSFSVVTLEDTSDEAAETVNLTLSNPINAELGARDTAVLSIADNDQPNLCTLFTVPVDDFENGLPSGTDGDGLDIGFVTWGDTWNGTTVAISDPLIDDTDLLALPGQIGPTHLLQLDVDVVVNGWGGLTHAFENETLDTWITQDWSSYEGVSFWVYGNNTGTTLFFEVQDNRNPGSTTSDTEIWSYPFPDDFSGWQYIEIPFSAFVRKEISNGAPNDGFGLTEVHGWAFGTLTTPGPITYYLDDVGLIVRTTVVDDFESGLPSGTDGDGLDIGFVTWGDFSSGTTIAISDPLVGDTDPLALPCQSGPTHLLQLDAHVEEYGGVTHAFENETVDTWITQDWSDYEGISFWAYGNNTGATLLFEIQDNRNPGSTTSDAEVFSYAFPDDFSGWQHFTLPFSAFTRKEISNGAPDDGFGRTEVHGWAFGMLANPGPWSYYVEDVTIWGRSAVTQPLQVSFAQVDYDVAEGGLAEVLVTLNMESTEPVTVTYTTEQADSLNRAVIDRDFTPTSGELVFEPGVTEQSFTVQTLQDIKYEGEELLRLRLSDPQNTELGYVYRARLYIHSDDPYNPLLLDDFEIFPYPFKTQGGLVLTTPEIAEADAMALPGQGPYEHILEVAHGSGPEALIPPVQSISRTFPMAQDWSGHESYNFWYYGTNSGEAITVELQENRLPDPGPAGWTLVWSDEFDGLADSSPMPGKWTHEIGNGFDQANTGWGNGELEYYTADLENSAMDGSGNLVITAQEINPATTELECWYGSCEYTSARMISSQKFEMAYGRVEARMKLPYGQGLWPAFWMLGNDIGDVGWPTCGEIDIMEHIGSISDRTYGTIHGPGYSGSEGIGGSYVLDEGSFSDDYHVFTIEWEPGEIRWYVDGELFLTLTDEDIPVGTEWVFDHPFFLILNVAVGGTWPGNPDETTVFPQTMTVDYIRVYQAPDTAERFVASFVDDFSGWQFVSIPLADFVRSATQPAGAPDDGLTLTEVWGHGFILNAEVGEAYYFDQLQLWDRFWTILPLMYRLGGG